MNRAERAYRRLLDPGVALGSVALGRAALFFDWQRWQEALSYAREALGIFSDRRDTKRYLEAREWEAMILHYLGDVAAARETYQKTYDLADSIGDAEMKARAAENLAVAYRDSGDMGSASRYLLIALQLFESLEQPAMVLVTRWSIARLSLASGNVADAALRLPSLITRFERLKMVNHAAQAQLDLAEALLILERFSDVAAVCEKLVAFFRNAHMLTGALTAVAFLREANSRRSLTRQHIVHVRQYLSALQRSPDLPFATPPDIH